MLDIVIMRAQWLEYEYDPSVLECVHFVPEHDQTMSRTRWSNCAEYDGPRVLSVPLQSDALPIELLEVIYASSILG